MSFLEMRVLFAEGRRKYNQVVDALMVVAVEVATGRVGPRAGLARGLPEPAMCPAGPLSMTWAVGLARLRNFDFSPGPARAREIGPFRPVAGHVGWASMSFFFQKAVIFGPGPQLARARPAMSTSPARQTRGSCRAMDKLPTISARHGTSLMGRGPGPTRIPLQPAGLARVQAQHGPWPALVVGMEKLLLM